MNFNSIEFLALFLPATLAVFYSVPLRLRLYVLAAASLIFYGVSGLQVLAAFVVAILWSYSTAFLLGRWPRSFEIVMATSVPLLILAMFKYLNFIFDTMGVGSGTRPQFWFFSSIVLPAGISFYTFELVSYSIDVADRKIAPDRSLLRFVAFATFFPHLIAGPIMRYAALSDQLKVIQTTRILKPNLTSGLKFLSIGLFFKIFVADVCGMMIGLVSHVQINELTAVDQLTEIGFWSMQIYYDFWAYSVMAIGLGRLFCIELPVNFIEPYLSENPREFWKRWHVTLSYWLRDYVYIRMGGREHYVKNIMVVFALVGLWHGAGWNFVAWGLYHGVLVLLYTLTAPVWDRLPRAAAIALCFLLVSFGWPLFFLNLGDYVSFIIHLPSAPWHFAIYHTSHWLYLSLVAFVTFGLRERSWLYNEPVRCNLVTDSPVFAAICLFLGLLFVSLSRTFIYFRF
jgi:alginate O-acetyltransferase complex protein AlgI